MKAFVLLLFAGGLFLLGAGKSCAEDDGLTVLLNRLTAFQTRVVAGDVEARGASQKQLKKIEGVIAGLDPETLRSDRNLREIALFLLAGGAPDVVRKLFSDGVLDPTKAPLVAAALAYAEGKRRDAVDRFKQIKEQEYPHRLGGHIALVKGGLLLGVDRKGATESLDWARLVMPGSLVEEAALRRLVVARSPAAEERQYLMLVRRYGELYRRSPFADSFKKFVLKRTLESAMKLDATGIEAFASALPFNSQAEALEWRLNVLRQALSEGRTDIASAQFEKAAELARRSGQSERMRLYNATLLAMQGKVGESELELAKANTLALGSDEQVLLKVVTAVLDRVKPPAAGEPPAVAVSAESKSSMLDQSPVTLSAQKALEAADALLKR